VDLTFVAIAVLGVLLTGIAKSGFGGGIGVVAVPMMAPFIGGEQAIGILLPILLLMDIMTLRVYRRYLSFALVKPLLPGILLGITAGTLLLGVVSERGVQALIGLIGFWVLAQKRWPWLAGRRRRQPVKNNRRRHRRCRVVYWAVSPVWAVPWPMPVRHRCRRIFYWVSSIRNRFWRRSPSRSV